MNGSVIIQQVINGLTIGMIYGLAALGFTMVYKALGLLNFSHADTLMIGALFSYTFVVNLNWPIYIALPFIVLIMMLYGLLLEKGVFRHFRNASKITFMLVSISVSGFLRNSALLVWGPHPRALPPIFGSSNINIGELVVPVKNIYIFVIALFFLGLLQFFFQKTKFGLAMRIAAEDPETAGLMGVRVSRTRAATFAITAALGGVAGVLVAPLFSVTIELGAALALKTFIAAVVGGVGNLPGAVVAGLLVGLLESISAGFISSGYRDVIVFATGIIILAFRPQGIFQRVITKH